MNYINTADYFDVEDKEMSAKQLDNNILKAKFKQLRKLIADGRFVEALQMIDNQLEEK